MLERSEFTDIQDKVWFDPFLSPKGQAFCRLARFDRPIGAWLLLIPALWSIFLAGIKDSSTDILGLSFIAVLFTIGAIVMRGAGCVVNDLWDQDIDAQVARTANRPLASGVIKRWEALVFLGCLTAIALVIVLLLRFETVILAAVSLIFVALYPLAKRVTHWPQVMLGLTFNFGALMGANAVLGGVPLFAMALYLGCIFWTVGYDTIYAHQDREDDQVVGVKSTALLLGDNSAGVIRMVYGCAAIFWAVCLLLVGGGVFAWAGLLAAVATLVWQLRTLNINDPRRCLQLFKFSAWTGWLFLGGLIVDFLAQ